MLQEWFSELSPWQFLVRGYLLTVVLEAPVIWFGVSPHHRPQIKAIACLALTAVTYPLVVLVLPTLIAKPMGYVTYLVIAELLAPTIEAWFFVRLISQTPQRVIGRDVTAIVSANFLSFTVGTLIT